MYLSTEKTKCDLDGAFHGVIKLLQNFKIQGFNYFMHNVIYRD